jgi:hypothetical protein
LPPESISCIGTQVFSLFVATTELAVTQGRKLIKWCGYIKKKYYKRKKEIVLECLITKVLGNSAQR